ncbi:MAG: sensor histidine kinase, partial [Anaerolineales bacterium]|nr:sensor histidine kinase [Anaerolineales bacterium]
GRQVGCNVRLMQLSEYNQDSAVLQERTRLSRELHDNLAQLVASIRIRTEEALICMGSEDTACARTIIMEVEALTRDLSSSLRDEILGLRVEDISEQGLITVLREHVDRYQRQWGIDTKVQVSNLVSWEVSPTVEIQLLRIIQEALSNARRHARADKVEISIREKDVGWLIGIEDDGIGFDPEKVSQEHIGLRSMKERATSFGGNLSIESRPDCGTQILIEVPGRLVHQSLLKELAE